MEKALDPSFRWDDELWNDELVSVFDHSLG